MLQSVRHACYLGPPYIAPLVGAQYNSSQDRGATQCVFSPPAVPWQPADAELNTFRFTSTLVSMATTSCTLSLLILLVAVAHCYGQRATNSRSDRITQAISASGDAINKAVAGDRASVVDAATKGRAFARMSTRDSTQPSDFGRRLMQGATNSRSDRISQAISASEDAIGMAVTGDRTSVRDAISKSKSFARMTVRDGAQPSDFGRKLMQGATNSRSDRISQAISASEDAIGMAVTGDRTSVRDAISKSKSFARMTVRDGAQPSDFGRKL